MNNLNLVKMKVEGSSKSHSRADIISRDVESVIDEPEARGGTNLGLTPTETLLASLIGCSNVITHRIAEKHGVKIENLDITADAKFDKSGASIIEEIEVEDEFEDIDNVYYYPELFEKINKNLKEKNLHHLLEKIENPLSNVLMKMEYEGIRLDLDLINEIKEIFEIEIHKLEVKIFEISEIEFNIASPKQLGEILFEKLALESKPKKTKTGQYSTSEETLSKLAKKHDFVNLILDWRSLQKLLTTYVYSLPKQIDQHSNRIHTEFNQTLTTTGRLSSINPNLQNIPIRTKKGK